MEARLAQHQMGLGAKYTAKRRPVKLLWFEEMESIEEAYVLEKRVQGWSRAKRIALIEGRHGDLPALSKRGFRPSEMGASGGRPPTSKSAGGNA